MAMISDLQFWTVFISGCALLISVFPHLKARFKKGKLKIDKYRTFFITHRVGSPSLNLHLIFKNVGGAPLSVHEVNLEVTKDKVDKFNLIGNGYLIEPNAQYFTILTPFELKGSETWSHTISFNELWKRKKQHKYRELESRIRDHIQGQVRFNPPEPGEFAVAKTEDIISISKFFEENFLWESGEYEVAIVVKGEDGKELARESFMFTLFESESDELLSYKEDLKFGFGVHLVPNRIHGINIDVTQ